MSQTSSKSAASGDQPPGSKVNGDLLQCPLCSQPRFFKGTKGLKIHHARIHNDKEAVQVNNLTIVDALNEDCWRLLLDYVDVRDIIRSERVSKQWQAVVHRYLRRIRFCVRYHIDGVAGLAVPEVKCRVLDVSGKPVYMDQVIEKYGPAIVVADCLQEAGLKALNRHSLDLEALRFKDGHISKILASSTLESLNIHYNRELTGNCLSALNSNLKTLQLTFCKSLDVDNLLTASHHLRDLTKLNLNCNSASVLQNVYKVLRETPNLEYLSLGGYHPKVDEVEVDLVEVDLVEVVEAICGLSRLKHLGLENNRHVRDSWLEAIGLRCRLTHLNLNSCLDVTASGVEAFCRLAGETLTELCVADTLFTDNVYRFVALCPNLQVTIKPDKYNYLCDPPRFFLPY